MICIIQARMGSKRLPGKVLMKIGKDSILNKMILSLKKVNGISDIIIATTLNGEDNKIINYCKKNKINYFRGSTSNVASRFYKILTLEDSKYFIRLNADSPFLDYRIIKKLISKIKDKNFDIITNVLKRSFPKGQSVEILKKEIYMKYYKKINNRYDKEHVTSYFYKNKNKFKIYNYFNRQNFSNINLSIDTIKDLKKIRSISARIKNKNFSWKNLVSIYLKHYE